MKVYCYWPIADDIAIELEGKDLFLSEPITNSERNTYGVANQGLIPLTISEACQLKEDLDKAINEYTRMTKELEDEMNTCSTCTHRKLETCTHCAGINFGNTIIVNSKSTCANYK